MAESKDKDKEDKKKINKLLIMTIPLINNAKEFGWDWTKNYSLWSVYHFQFIIQKVLIYILLYKINLMDR